MFVFVLQFFRDPHRTPPNGDTVVCAPADGRVIFVKGSIDPYTGLDSLKISIFMNVFNVHSNRIPVDGLIKKRQYFPGSFFNAALDKASMRNERNALVMQTTTGHSVTFVQVAGLVARRILCYVESGEQVEKGQRYGFIRFGSRVDVYLPKNTQVKVSLGDRVTGGVTILANLK